MTNPGTITVTPPTTTVAFHAQGREIVRFNKDGTIWVNPDLTPTKPRASSSTLCDPIRSGICTNPQ